MLLEIKIGREDLGSVQEMQITLWLVSYWKLDEIAVMIPLVFEFI